MSNHRSLRIIIFNWRDSAHPNAGGAEIYTHRVATEWVKMGHAVTLFCSSVKGQSEDEVVNGIRIIRRGTKHSVYREARRFYQTEGRNQFDVAIDEINTRPFQTPKWIKDIPVIALIHQVCREIWFYEYRLPIALIGRFILEPWWLHSYRRIPTVTVSQSSAESLMRYGLKDITVIPEGMDPVDRVSVIARETTPTIIFVGRLTANKRPDDALAAYQIIRRQCPEAQMWIVGSGPMEPKLRTTSPDGVEFLGRISDHEKRNRLAQAHVLVVSSVREGWGLVVTEAAQHGTIAVGYDVPGLRDSIAASSGVLVEESPVCLANAILKLFKCAPNGSQIEVTPSGVSPWKDVANAILKVFAESFSHEFEKCQGTTQS